MKKQVVQKVWKILPKQNNFRNSFFFSKERGCVNGIFGYIRFGYCDDENNNTGCHFDGGDCCGVNINTQYCNISIRHERN